MKKLLRDEKGAQLVEFAFVLPVLLVLLLGIIEFGLMMYDKAVITNASREGARFAVNYVEPGFIPPTTADIQSVVYDYAAPNLISLSGSTTPIVPPPLGAPCAAAGDPVTVTVSYSFGFLGLPAFSSLFGSALPSSVMLEAQSTMRCE